MNKCRSSRHSNNHNNNHNDGYNDDLVCFDCIFDDIMIRGSLMRVLAKLAVWRHL